MADGCTCGGPAVKAMYGVKPDCPEHAFAPPPATSGAQGGQPEDWRERLARVAATIGRVSPDDVRTGTVDALYEVYSVHFPEGLPADIRAALVAAQGEGGPAERRVPPYARVADFGADEEDAEPAPPAVQGGGGADECSGYNVDGSDCMRVHCGHGHHAIDADRPAAGPGGGLDREALRAAVATFQNGLASASTSRCGVCSGHSPSWDGHSGCRDAAIHDLLAAVAPLLTGGGRDGG